MCVCVFVCVWPESSFVSFEIEQAHPVWSIKCFCDKNAIQVRCVNAHDMITELFNGKLKHCGGLVARAMFI